VLWKSARPAAVYPGRARRRATSAAGRENGEAVERRTSIIAYVLAIAVSVIVLLGAIFVVVYASRSHAVV